MHTTTACGTSCVERSRSKQLAQAKAEANRAPRVEVVEAKIAVKGVVTDANGLIEKLADDSTTGADVASQRRVIHYFESLYDAGNDAVPAIATFLEQDLDKEFGRQSMRQQLNITTSQMEEMRAYGESQREEIGTKMREIWGNQELSREERGEKMREMFTGITEKYKEMMTPEQRAKLEELGGEDGQRDLLRGLMRGDRGGGDRSEEHTSELQSQAYLVCRLLLEKKKKTLTSTSHI